MFLTIKLYPDPILMQKTKKIDTITNSHFRVLNTMKNFCKDNDWLGLTANQIGYLYSMFVIKNKTFINPEIIEYSKEQNVADECCVSIPYFTCHNKKRFTVIKIKYIDENGKEHIKKLSNTKARVFQHEFDHTQGKLIIDNINKNNIER